MLFATESKYVVLCRTEIRWSIAIHSELVEFACVGCEVRLGSDSPPLAVSTDDKSDRCLRALARDGMLRRQFADGCAVQTYRLKMTPDLDRFLWGAEAIGAEANVLDDSGAVDIQRTYYMLEKKLLPADKVGRAWVSTPRRLRSILSAAPLPEQQKPLPDFGPVRDEFQNAVSELLSLSKDGSSKFVGVVPADRLRPVVAFLRRVAAATKAAA